MTADGLWILDHGRPVPRPGVRVLGDADGIRAAEPVQRPDCLQPRGWRAQWIGLDPAVYPDCQTSPRTWFCAEERRGHRHTVALFRREFTLDAAAASVRAWVSADTKYRLYVNGLLAGRGPAEAGGDYGNTDSPSWWFYDAHGLTPFFREGVNVVAAEVAFQGDCMADHSMGRGGFLFQAEAVMADGRRCAFATDGGWRAARGEAFAGPGLYDARRDLPGWTLPGFDDSSWPCAQVVAAATCGAWNLIPAEIPPRLEAEVLPVRVRAPFEETRNRIRNPDALLRDDAGAALLTPGAPLTFWVDFPRELTGYVRLALKGVAGTRLTLAFEETPGFAHQTESLVLRDGLQAWHGFRLQAFQHVRVTVERFTGPVEILGLRATFASYPVAYQGEFSCSDDLLNEVWKVGRWTTQLCMQGYHLDSPVHQEPLGCTGDYMIEALVNYCAFGGPWLPRQDLIRTARLLGQKKGRMFHTSYTLLWIQMLMDYVDYTGDEALAKDLAPVVFQVLDLFGGYCGASGLVTEAPNYMFLDWVEAGGFSLHHPPCAVGQGYMTAFYVQALRNGCRVAAIIGDRDRCDALGRRAEQAAQAFQRELWTPERGLYADGRPGRTSVLPSAWLPADPDRVSFSLHTNALAVACGVAPSDLRAAVLARAVEDPSLPRPQPYFMHYVLNALAAAGLFERFGLGLIRQWKAPLDEHPSSWKENWDWGDYSHAWSSTPTYQLSTRVLGVTPAAPGFAVAAVRPLVCDLAWARGRVPTPRGPVSVSWRGGERDFDLEVEVPPGSTGRVSVPGLGLSRPVVRENGQTVWPPGARPQGRVLAAGPDGDGVAFTVPAGAYRFHVGP